MNNNAPAAVAAAYFEALGRGDVPTAMGLMSPQVVWHQPGRTSSQATTPASTVWGPCWAG